ncbi:hypothetical protein ACJZ2D_003950 [Fusarium nematophilum]
MAEQMATPRVTSTYLDSFVGRVVMLVGKVTQLRGDQATLDSEGTVTVLLNREAHLVNGNAVQVIGKVNPDLSIKVLSSRDLGNGVDHGPYQHSQAYAPRVAMVWTSPLESRAQDSPSRQRQASHNDQYGKSNTITHDPPSPTTIRPTTIAYAAGQRLQQATHSSSSRPSTAMSFTTSSSDMILGRDLESRSPSPSPPSPSLISRTPTPTPPQTLLPSPPEEDSLYSSYSTTDRSRRSSALSPPSSQQSYEQIYHPQSSQQSSSIPSAQPYTPVAPLSPQSFSSPSLLPSPPMTQPREDPFRSSHGAPVSPAASPLSTTTRLHSVPAPRRFPAGRATTTIANSDLEGPDSALLDSVLEGIGRIHVTMGRDDAGRWRIKRAPDGRS